MKPVKNKKGLEIKIQQIPPHPNPKVALEQYSTPATIAADILWNAYGLGDIFNKNILDLGCGTGIFTISPLLLGAKSAIGVDVDKESIEVAEKSSESFNVRDCSFVTSDIVDLKVEADVDTVFQNPPFGSQKRATRGIDLEFIKKAMEFHPAALYTFHMASTEDFLVDFFSRNGMEITHIFRYDFSIPKTYDFHSKESRDVKVIVLRAKPAL